MRRFRTQGETGFGRFIFIIFSAFSLILYLPSLPGNDRAMAVDINLVHMTTGSDNPDSDPDASKLIALMDVLEGYYEDIFTQDIGHPFTVKYRYETDISSLAQFSSDGTPLADENGYPLSGLIRINPDINWFIDPTPLDNSEFNMQQVFYEDLSSTQQAERFNGDVPDMLEVEYKGYNNYSDPNASNAYDLWSVVMHEMGHGLGMLSPFMNNDVGDNDYDFNPALVWGNTMAANCYNTSNHRFHLKGSALMDPYISKNERHLPAMIDIFAMADGAEWGPTTIDLKRKEFYNAGAWADFNTALNWAGNRIPDSQDEVFIRHGGGVSMSSDDWVDDLTLGNGSTLAMTGHQLTIYGQTQIGTSSTDTGTVEVGTGVFAPKNLTVAGGSNVLIDGGMLCPKTCTVEYNGAISGFGTFEIYESLHLAGQLRAEGGDLTIQAASGYSPVLDLGDSSYAKTIAQNGNIIFDLPLGQAQGGIFQVYDDRSITFNHPWSLANGGKIYLYPRTSAAKIAGEQVTIDGWLYGNGDNAEMDCPVILRSQAEVAFGVTTITFSQELELQAGAYLHGVGTLVANGSFMCHDGAVIGIDVNATDQVVIGTTFGEVTMDNQFQLASTAELIMDMGRNGLGQFFSDHLIALDEVELGGATLLLNVPEGGADLAIGDQFDLFDWDGTLTGTFGSVIQPSGYTFDLSDLYTSGTVTVESVGQDLPGDANRDGVVDGSDATILANNWQATGADWSMGDFNGDHVVDGSDATLLANNWQEGTPPVSTAVPEPSSMTLLLCLTTFGIFAVRRRLDPAR